MSPIGEIGRTYEKRYGVHSIFRTVQGEGFHAGSVAVFVRFTGCNVWSGFEMHRQRDSAKSSCALFCDTEFARPDIALGGGMLTAKQIAESVADLWPHKDVRHVVFTGGEPTLQVDEGLTGAFRELSPCYLQLETNGSNPAPRGVDWVTVSPKPPLALHPDCGADELKVLFPDMYREEWEAYPVEHRFLQVVDRGPETDMDLAAEKLIEFLLEHPQWRLSTQLHKLYRIP